MPRSSGSKLPPPTGEVAGPYPNERLERCSRPEAHEPHRIPGSAMYRSRWCDGLVRMAPVGLTPHQRQLIDLTFHADPKVEQLRVDGVTVTRREWEEGLNADMFEELLRTISKNIWVQESENTPPYPSRADACLAALQWFVRKSPEHHNYLLRLLQVKEQGST